MLPSPIEGGADTGGGSSAPGIGGGAGTGGGGAAGSQGVIAGGGGGVGTWDIPVTKIAAGVPGQGPARQVRADEIVEIWPNVTGANKAYIGQGVPSAATVGPRFVMSGTSVARIVNVRNLAEIFVDADNVGEGAFISIRKRGF